MPMDKKVLKELQAEQPNEKLVALFERCKALVELSRTEMAKYYDTWDCHDNTYQGIKEPDAADKKAAEKKDPVKMTVPVTHSQVQTFVAFAFSVLFQREFFFELVPYSVEATRAEKIGEALLQRDLDWNKWTSKVYQFLLDVGRFGISVFKNSWHEEVVMKKTTSAPRTASLFGVEVKWGGGQTAYERKVTYQGNKITNVSPYRWFPDPRFPMNRFQEGEFVASEDEYSYTALKQMENDGMVAGLEYVHNLSQVADQPSAMGRRLNKVELATDRRLLMETQGASIITEVEITLVPAKTLIAEDEPLGEEDFPVKYLVWYVNDERIIRMEPLDYPCGRYTYEVGQFSPDIHHFINDGLAGVIDVMQDVISWYINSHITNVRKVIRNRLIVDPEAVNLDDIREDRVAIRLKQGKNRLGIDSYLKQLQVSDATAGHMQDANLLHSMVQIVSGINDNALGQFNTGRRSATEARNVNAGVASRLKMTVQILYYDAIEPLGRQMLENLRQGLTLETYVKVFGLIKDPTLDHYFEFIKVTSKDLLTGNYDFEMLDGTTPGEKIYTAETLMELFTLLLQQPEMAVFMGYDLRAIFTEILKLRGIRHPEQFTLAEQQRSAILTQIATMQLLKGANGNNGGQGQAGSSPGGNGAASSNGAGGSYSGGSGTASGRQTATAA